MKKRMQRWISVLLLCAVFTGLLTVEASAAMRMERLTMTEGETYGTLPVVVWNGMSYQG